MANETTYALFSDPLLAEQLATEMIMLLSDREQLPAHDALLYAGDLAGRGSATLKVSQLGLDGYELPASTAEGVAVANSLISTDKFTLTIGRFSKSYKPTDLVRMLSPDGSLNLAMLAQDAMLGRSYRLVDLVANVIDGYTAVVEDSGIDMTVEHHLAAKATLELAGAQGRPLAVYHSRQWADLMLDLQLNGGGAIVYNPANPALLAKFGNGYKGDLAGVDVFVTNRVPTANAGADRAGGMFVRGGVAWADATVSVEDPANQISLGGKVLLERARDAHAASTAFVSHTYLSAALGEDARGVSIITDA